MNPPSSECTGGSRLMAGGNGRGSGDVESMLPVSSGSMRRACGVKRGVALVQRARRRALRPHRGEEKGREKVRWREERGAREKGRKQS
eukprot:scaffold103637_cov32-Tisochrysis_lutea.AAC.3